MHTSPCALHVLIIMTLYLNAEEAMSLNLTTTSSAQEFNVSNISLIPNRKKRCMAGVTRQLSVEPYSQLDGTNNYSINTHTGNTTRGTQLTANNTDIMAQGLKLGNVLTDPERSKRLAEEQLDEFYLLGEILPNDQIPVAGDSKSTNASCGLSPPVPTSQMFDPGGSMFTNRPGTRLVTSQQGKRDVFKDPISNLRNQGPHKLQGNHQHKFSHHNSLYSKGYPLGRYHRPVSVLNRGSIRNKNTFQTKTFSADSELNAKDNVNEFQIRDFGFLGKDNQHQNAFRRANQEIIKQITENVQGSSNDGPRKKSIEMTDSLRNRNSNGVYSNHKTNEFKSPDVICLHQLPRHVDNSAEVIIPCEKFSENKRKLKHLKKNAKHKIKTQVEHGFQDFNHKDTIQKQNVDNQGKRKINIAADKKPPIKIPIYVPNHVYLKAASVPTSSKQDNVLHKEYRSRSGNGCNERGNKLGSNIDYKNVLDSSKNNIKSLQHQKHPLNQIGGYQINKLKDSSTNTASTKMLSGAHESDERNSSSQHLVNDNDGFKNKILDDISVDEMLMQLDIDLKEPFKFRHNKSNLKSKSRRKSNTTAHVKGKQIHQQNEFRAPKKYHPLLRVSHRTSNENTIDLSTMQVRNLGEENQETIQDYVLSQPAVQVRYLKEKDRSVCRYNSQPELIFRDLNEIPKEPNKEKSPNKPPFRNLRVRSRDNYQDNTFDQYPTQFRDIKSQSRDTIEGTPSPPELNFGDFELKNQDNFRDNTFYQPPLQFKDFKGRNQVTIEDHFPSKPDQQLSEIDQNNIQENIPSQHPWNFNYFNARYEDTIEANPSSEHKLKLRKRTQDNIQDIVPSRPTQGYNNLNTMYQDNIKDGFHSQPEKQFRNLQVRSPNTIEDDYSPSHPELKLEDYENRKQEFGYSKDFVQQLNYISGLEKSNQQRLGKKEFIANNRHENLEANEDQMRDREYANDYEIGTRKYLTGNIRSENLETNEPQNGDLDYTNEQQIATNKYSTLNNNPEDLQPNEDLDYSNEQLIGTNKYSTLNNNPEDLQPNEDLDYSNEQRIGKNKYSTLNNNPEDLQPNEDLDYSNEQRIGKNKYSTLNNNLEDLQPNEDLDYSNEQRIGKNKYSTLNNNPEDLQPNEDLDYSNEQRIGKNKYSTLNNNPEDLQPNEDLDYSNEQRIKTNTYLTGNNFPENLEPNEGHVGDLEYPNQQRIETNTYLGENSRPENIEPSEEELDDTERNNGPWFGTSRYRRASNDSSWQLNRLEAPTKRLHRRQLDSRQLAEYGGNGKAAVEDAKGRAGVVTRGSATKPPSRRLQRLSKLRRWLRDTNSPPTAVAASPPFAVAPPVAATPNASSAPSLQQVAPPNVAPAVYTAVPVITNNALQQSSNWTNVNPTYKNNAFTPNAPVSSVLSNQIAAGPQEFLVPPPQNNPVFPELSPRVGRPFFDPEGYVVYSYESPDDLENGAGEPLFYAGDPEFEEHIQTDQQVPLDGPPFVFIEEPPPTSAGGDQKREADSTAAQDTTTATTATAAATGNPTAAGNGTASNGTDGSHQYLVFTAGDERITRPELNDTDEPATTTTQKSINETAVLWKMLAELKEIKSEEKTADQGKDGLACSMDGTWVADTAGVKLTIAGKDKEATSVIVASRTPPRKNALLSADWKLRVTVPFAHGSMFLLTGVSGDKRLARFIGQCRVCHGRDIVTGIWSIAHPARDCRDLDLGMTTTVRRDVFRREKPLTTTPEPSDMTTEAGENSTAGRQVRSSDAEYADFDSTWIWNYDD